MFHYLTKNNFNCEWNSGFNRRTCGCVRLLRSRSLRSPGLRKDLRTHTSTVFYSVCLCPNKGMCFPWQLSDWFVDRNQAQPGAQKPPYPLNLGGSCHGYGGQSSLGGLVFVFYGTLRKRGGSSSECHHSLPKQPPDYISQAGYSLAISHNAGRLFETRHDGPNECVFVQK